MLRKFLVLAAFLGLTGLSANVVFARQFSGNNSQTDGKSNAVYQWVRNADNVAHEVGDVVVYRDSTNDGVDIGTTTTANDKLVAGVVVESDIAAGGWGFIQVSGYCPEITIGVANAAGDALVTSTTGEAAGVFTVSGTTTTTGTALTTAEALYLPAVFAIALEATTASDTVKGILLR